MNIINFINRFPDEVSCVEFIKEQRIKQGIICKKCTGCNHYRLENKHSFQCASCGFQNQYQKRYSHGVQQFISKDMDDGHHLRYRYQERIQCSRTSTAIGNEAL